MGKMKELLLEIVEAYDYNGLTIKDENHIGQLEGVL